VEETRIERFRRIRKSKKIRTQPLCGEYPSWISYLSFEEEDCGSFLCMILGWMWLKKVFFKGKNVYVTLNKNEESMETRCTFIVMEND
jgi:hypothetical protein